MAANNLDDDEIVSINITPMVDIMLVLLVIFMVTTTAIQKIEGMEVNKPDANTGQPISDKKPQQIKLACHSDGSVYVDGTETKTDQEIVKAIKNKLKIDSDLQGIIACDEKAQVAALVHLMDLLRENGVKKYGIVTEKPKNPLNSG